MSDKPAVEPVEPYLNLDDMRQSGMTVRGFGGTTSVYDAANEIERLRTRCAELEEALTVAHFAICYSKYEPLHFSMR